MFNQHAPFPAVAFVFMVFGSVGFWKFMRWINAGPLRPDPWDSEIEKGLQSVKAVPVCRRCFVEQRKDAHFCPECGTSVGDYNNLLPYVYIFSVGEALRTGVSGKYRITPVTTAGYFLWSMTEYTIFAPVYWFFLFRNVNKISTEMHDASRQSDNETLI